MSIVLNGGTLCMGNIYCKDIVPQSPLILCLGSLQMKIGYWVAEDLYQPVVSKNSISFCERGVERFMEEESFTS